MWWSSKFTGGSVWSLLLDVHTSSWERVNCAQTAGTESRNSQISPLLLLFCLCTLLFISLTCSGLCKRKRMPSVSKMSSHMCVCLYIYTSRDDELKKQSLRLITFCYWSRVRCWENCGATAKRGELNFIINRFNHAHNDSVMMMMMMMIRLQLFIWGIHSSC